MDASSVEIVICVHNALDDVRRCLAAVVRQTSPRHRLILVDDGSEVECRDYLTDFAGAHPRCLLIRNEARRGYSAAANRGLRASAAGFVVLLNSDTVVTPRWLERLLECAASDPRIGIVGPLSNAAQHQSVPRRFDAEGDWSLNPLPPGWGPDAVAAAIAAIAPRAFPRAAVINGFCFGITRAVIDAIGYFDEVGFADGYGEEADYCLRAADAGFQLAVADHAYVYHAKTRSYTSQQRERLWRAGRKVLERRYGKERIAAAATALYDDPALRAIRRELRRCLAETLPPEPAPVPGPMPDG